MSVDHGFQRQVCCLSQIAVDIMTAALCVCMKQCRQESVSALLLCSYTHGASRMFSVTVLRQELGCYYISCTLPAACSNVVLAYKVPLSC